VVAVNDEVGTTDLTTGVTHLRIVGAPGVAEIVLRCVCDTEIPDRDGRLGRGFTNLKRLLGYPQDFSFIVDELAATVPPGHAIAACDEGSCRWPARWHCACTSRGTRAKDAEDLFRVLGR
jgi:hypothetical protein